MAFCESETESCWMAPRSELCATSELVGNVSSRGMYCIYSLILLSEFLLWKRLLEIINGNATSPVPQRELNVNQMVKRTLIPQAWSWLRLPLNFLLNVLFMSQMRSNEFTLHFVGAKVLGRLVLQSLGSQGQSLISLVREPQLLPGALELILPMLDCIADAIP